MPAWSFAVPALAPAIAALGEAYVAVRYLPGATAADAARFQALARACRERLRAAQR